MSWISLDDVVGALHHAIAEESLAGPVNLVAPNPVDNRTFARTLGRVLRRPAVLPLPSAVVKLLFGEMGEALLLQGAHIHPTRLLESGFEFGSAELEAGLREELGR
jgi:NAD dependent epimerase/dehydratase family enzyme